MDYGIYEWDWMLIVCSFIGFSVENIWTWNTRGYADNRGMHLPLLFGYGAAVYGIYRTAGLPEPEGLSGISAAPYPAGDPEYFVSVFLLVSCGEIILGKAVHAVCGFDYWDYSRLPFHLTKYTSLFTSLGFTCLIMGFMGHCFTPVMEFAETVDSPICRIAVHAVVTGMLIDCAWSFRYMYQNGGSYIKWRIYKAGKEMNEDTASHALYLTEMQAVHADCGTKIGAS